MIIANKVVILSLSYHNINWELPLYHLFCIHHRIHTNLVS